MIFTAAADDEDESIVESAFENVEQGKYGIYIAGMHCVLPSL